MSNAALRRAFNAFVDYLREPAEMSAVGYAHARTDADANADADADAEVEGEVEVGRGVAVGLPPMSEPLANSLRVAFLQYEGLPLHSTAKLSAHVGTLLRDEAQFHSLLATVRPPRVLLPNRSPPLLPPPPSLLSLCSVTLLTVQNHRFNPPTPNPGAG